MTTIWLPEVLEGLQEKEVALPVACKVALLPAQIVAEGGEIPTRGNGRIETVTLLVALTQPLLLPFTLYRLFEVGVATTMLPEVELSPLLPPQTYAEAPLTVKVSLSPGQTPAELWVSASTGLGIMEKTALAVSRQVALAPMSVAVAIVERLPLMVELKQVITGPLGADVVKLLLV